MFLSKLDKALQKAKQTIFSRLQNYFISAKEIDESFWLELEECLIESDVSYSFVQNILQRLKTEVKIKKITTTQAVKEELKSLLINELTINTKSQNQVLPFLLILLGVNGVGKTTAAAKLANYYRTNYKIESIFCAADTFRAAAIDQLNIWADRLNIDIVKHKEGADPSAVLFDTIQAAKARRKQLIIVDTAGRLHTKKNLIAELEKMLRVAQKEVKPELIEVLLVLDATVGQNGLMQAKTFAAHLPVNGLILTKLDGTAKGGIAISIVKELGIPIKFISTGEGIDDFEIFSPQLYCNALLNFQD
jgi:fused signal recognition particle receptor